MSEDSLLLLRLILP